MRASRDAWEGIPVRVFAMSSSTRQEDIRKQFLLVRGDDVVDRRNLPEAWCEQKFGAWILFHGPDLPVVSRGEQVWILGLALDFDRGSPVSRSDSRDENIEGLVRGWGGRFLVLEQVDTACDLVRIWSDAAGSLCAFMHRQFGWLASTPTLIGRIFGERFAMRSTMQRRVLQRLVEHTGTWYPAGLSEWQDWELLAPAHVTEIAEDGVRTVRRFWPVPGVKVAAAAPAEVLPGFVARLAGMLRLLASVHPLEIPVSAGRDSRMLLACSRGLKRQTRYSVRSLTGDDHCLEVDVSCALAEVLALDHHVDEPVDAARILCMGYGGEVARRHYELPGADDLQSATKAVARELGFLDAGISSEEMDFVLRRLEVWVSGLAGLPEGIRGDLLYLEQRMAPTMSVVLHRDDLGCRFAVAPLNAFALYDLLFSLPMDYRREWRVVEEVCRLAWPATRMVPFQKTYFTGREKLCVGVRLMAAPLLGRDYLRAWRSPIFRKIWRSRGSGA